MKLEGVYTALVTPMSEDGKLDEKALRRLVDFQIEGGVQGLVPVGTTGESPTLDGEECKRVIRIVVEQARGRVPVIGGAGSNSTAEAIEYARDAKEAGADATLQVAPYYNKPTNDGILAHFRAIADAVDLPLVVYNIAGRTGKNIDNSDDARACRAPQHRGREGSKRRHRPDHGPDRPKARRISPCSPGTTTSCSPSWRWAARG